jgi:hypothetical protein
MGDDTALMFQDELGPNERIFWSGRPRRGLRLQLSDLYLIPFSLLWGGFAIFWEVGVITGGAPFFFALWGIPFVLIGLYLIFGRFFVDAWQRAKTYYALTNERIIIISGLFSRNVKSLNLRTLSDINLNKKWDGTGTITFGPGYPMGWTSSSSGWPGAGTLPTFEMIKNAKEVYDKIREAQMNLP